MKAQKRLELYEKALIDYEKRGKRCNFFWHKKSFSPEGYYYGFCWYFEVKYKIHLRHLPELYKPEKPNKKFYYNKHIKHPRIKDLKKAIETVKKLIND